MCAISGFLNYPPSLAPAALIAAMNEAQRHRGPDGDGVFLDGRAALGHRRLSIIDLAGGGQPMTNEDGTLQLVFNGEIYNYRALRRRLEEEGHRFHSRSDTEVILHLYESLGEAAAAELHGMFAFALWDAGRDRLLLGRDRTGQKPLLYFQAGRQLVFASEMAALKLHPAFSGELDEDAVSDFLSLQYVPSPRSIYRQVHKLPPAHTLVFDAEAGTARLRRYWRPDYAVKTDLSPADAAAENRRLVEAAVEKRLMADVPVGTFLSGGLDSAIITAVMTRMRLPESTMAFTVGFEDPAYDERAGARLMARTIDRYHGGKLIHLEKTVDSSDFELVRRLLPHYGEPFADASMLPTHLLCRFARERATMVLSGDGADELFGGYERYRVMTLAARLNRCGGSWRKISMLLARMLPDAGERTRPGRLRRLCRVLAAPPIRQYFELLNRCPETVRDGLFGERMRSAVRSDAADALLREMARASAKTPAETAMECDLHSYLPGDTLPKMDIASMAASLEVRSPFLDHELIEFAASLPLAYKLRGGSRKHILKEAFADLLPPEIRDGRKRGFGVPVAAWLRSCWQKPGEATLFGGPLVSGGWVREEALNRLWREHQSGRRDHSYLLWNLIVLALFLEAEH